LPLSTALQKRALRAIREQVLSVQQQLACDVLSSSTPQQVDPATLLESWMGENEASVDHYLHVLEEIQKNPLTDLAPLVVMERELERLYERTAGVCLMTAMC
jgi:NAD-specific glutamate dehydrogenase